MGGKYRAKGKGVKNIVNKRKNEGGHSYGEHITMKQMARCAGVQPCTIQQNVNMLRKYIIPQLK